ncbi:MAG: hypothetical protein JNL58_08695 [Planctomyces sp.]|nr:hypothetical protein [Planctomyces sp.]
MVLDLSGCLQHYDNHGIFFEYPDIWEITEEIEPDGDVLITVSADGACFWAIRILASSPAPPDVVGSCVSAFQEEYEDVDEYPSSGQLAQMPAYGRDLEFSCFELLNTVSLKSVRGPEFTILVWWQGTDHELGDVRPVFEQITSTVRIKKLM